MTEWIRSLKQGDEESAESHRIASQMKLRADGIISDKLSRFWPRLMQELQQQADELRSAFPDIQSRHCRVEESPRRSAYLHGASAPFRTIHLALTKSNTLAERLTVKQDAVANPTLIDTRDIRIVIDDADQLVFMVEAKAGRRTPEELASYYLQRLIA